MREMRLSLLEARPHSEDYCRAGRRYSEEEEMWRCETCVLSLFHILHLSVMLLQLCSSEQDVLHRHVNKEVLRSLFLVLSRTEGGLV